jgi:hypothetical protein
VFHDRNDLRSEYPLSIQRYVLTEATFFWDDELDTTLPASPLPEIVPEIKVDLEFVGGGKGKGKGKGGGGGGITRAQICNKPFDCAGHSDDLHN